MENFIDNCFEISKIQKEKYNIDNNNNNHINDSNKDLDFSNGKENNFNEIIMKSKGAELIKASIEAKARKAEIKFDETIKEKITNCLDCEIDKNTETKILSSFKYMSNLNEKDCEKPIEIINSNLKFEKKNESIKESIDLIEYMENKKIKIKEETKELLVDYINSNDFTEDTAEIIEEKSEKNFNNFINQYKEKLNDKLIEIYENNKDNDLLINQMKDKMKKLNINPNNKVLTPKQKDQKDTSMKALNNLKKMAESSEGLSDNILIKLSQNLKKIEPKETKSKEFQKLLKKQSINIIYSEIYNHKDKKIPDEIINSLSENIQIKKPKRVLESISKVADNQSLPKQTIFNLTNIINDNKNNF